MTDTDEQIVMAKLAYSAYAEAVDNKDFQGNPLRGWDGMSDTTRAGWVSAAAAVAAYLMGPPSADE